jgi:hypothetical protein
MLIQHTNDQIDIITGPDSNSSWLQTYHRKLHLDSSASTGISCFLDTIFILPFFDRPQLLAGLCQFLSTISTHAVDTKEYEVRVD